MQQQFKAFWSLEAYNQMVSGFITSMKGHIIANKFVVLAKVRHFSFIPIWIITEREGTVLSAHYWGCKAGLAESCSRIATVLFYLEAWMKVRGVRNYFDLLEADSTMPVTAAKKIPVPTEAEMNTFSGQLWKCRDSKPIALSLIAQFAKNYVLNSRTIPTINDLFDRNLSM